MALSVVDPVTPAIERTKRLLFQPFDIGKWFALGFTAFLAELAAGGNGTSFNCSGNPFSSGGGSGGNQGGGSGNAEIAAWLQQHLTLVIGIVAAVVLVSIAVSLAITWVGCRGQFMFLDNVVHNRADVRRPWREFARLGNSLFGFRLVFGLSVFAAVLLVLGGGFLVAWSDIENRRFGAGAGLALAGGIGGLVVLGVASGLVNLFLHHFVVPIMYLRNATVMAAWAEFRQAVLRGRGGVFALYVLFQVPIGMAVGIIAGLAMCLTLCLVAVPYLGSVILLPLSVFYRSYSLYFLEQFGPDYRFFAPDRTLPDDPPEHFGGSRPIDDRFTRGE